MQLCLFPTIIVYARTCIPPAILLYTRMCALYTCNMLYLYSCNIHTHYYYYYYVHGHLFFFSLHPSLDIAFPTLSVQKIKKLFSRLYYYTERIIEYPKIWRRTGPRKFQTKTFKPILFKIDFCKSFYDLKHEKRKSYMFSPSA